MIILQQSRTALLVFIPLALTATFLLDVIGPFDPVVSVLYLPVIVLSTRAFSRLGVTYVGSVCAVMTCASFVLAKVEGFDPMKASQFIAILIAIAATTSLSLRLARRRRKVASQK